MSHDHAEHDHEEDSLPCGCPSAAVIAFPRDEDAESEGRTEASNEIASELRQWPIQLHLVPPTAPYYEGADLLLAADCCAFALGDFHRKHLRGKALAIACPKLDEGQAVYLKKLVAMIDEARVNTISVMVMEVPCCTGLLSLAKQAVAQAGRSVPVKMIKVGLRGEILADEWT